MIKKIVVTIVFIGQILILNAQEISELKNIVEMIKKKAVDEISIKCFDLDNDGDNDYLFTYCCGEPNCFEVFLTINGKLKRVISERGNISFDYENSVDYLPSHLIIKSDFSHCCGESPFDSFRRFVFKDDNYEIIENYVRYDHEDYCEDELWHYTFLPPDELRVKKDYYVIITKEGNNIRFSADLERHKANFTCIENSNIIGQLKEGAEVKVSAERKGKDSNLRTWLYVEIKKSDLKTDKCASPLSYDFKDQKLRGWISDKYTIKK